MMMLKQITVLVLMLVIDTTVSTSISEYSNARLHEQNEMLMNRLESTLQRRPSKLIENILMELRKVSHETPSEESFGILRTAKRELARKDKKRLRSTPQLFLQVNEMPDVQSLLPSAADKGLTDMMGDIADDAKEDVEDNKEIAKQNEETQALTETKEKLDAQQINADQFDKETKAALTDSVEPSSCASQYTMCVERTEEYRRICIEAYKSTKSKTARGTRREHLKYRLELEGEYKEKYSTPEDDDNTVDDYNPGNDEDLDSTGPAPEKQSEEEEEEEMEEEENLSSTGLEEDENVNDEEEDPQTQSSEINAMENELMDDTIKNMEEMS